MFLYVGASLALYSTISWRGSPSWFLFSVDLQEYLSTECVSSDSQMELSNVSWSRSILNMAECSQRKLVTALSQHVTYGKAITHLTYQKLDIDFVTRLHSLCQSDVHSYSILPAPHQAQTGEAAIVAAGVY